MSVVRATIAVDLADRVSPFDAGKLTDYLVAAGFVHDSDGDFDGVSITKLGLAWVYGVPSSRMAVLTEALSGYIPESESTEGSDSDLESVSIQEPGPYEEE